MTILSNNSFFYGTAEHFISNTYKTDRQPIRMTAKVTVTLRRHTTGCTHAFFSATLPSLSPLSVQEYSEISNSPCDYLKSCNLSLISQHFFLFVYN